LNQNSQIYAKERSKGLGGEVEASRFFSGQGRDVKRGGEGMKSGCVCVVVF